MSRTRLFLLGLLFLGVTLRTRADDVALVSVGESWRFWYAVTEPPANWTSPQYSDHEWFLGESGFGRSALRHR